jgi:hypothetical protein
VTQHDLPRTAAQLSLQMHPIGTALTDCASRLAYIRELLPQRGELVEEFRELVTTLAWIERTYRDADEALTKVAYELQHAQDVPHPLPLNGSA